MDALFANVRLRVAVTGRNLDDLLPMLRLFPADVVDDNPDLVISYGGDGSLLGAEQRFPGIPKCPLRDFRQNPKCPAHADLSILEKLFRGELDVTQLPKLTVEFEDGASLCGINDIVIARQQIASAIRYRIWLDGHLFRPQVVADSLVVATPFGSTGYFQSITRGTFLTGLGLAFPNAMDLAGFSIIHPDASIAVELIRGPAEVVADNDPHIRTLDSGARLRIRQLEEKTTVYGLEAFRCLDCYNLRRNGL